MSEAGEYAEMTQDERNELKRINELALTANKNWEKAWLEERQKNNELKKFEKMVKAIDKVMRQNLTSDNRVAKINEILAEGLLK